MENGYAQMCRCVAFGDRNRGRLSKSLNRITFASIYLRRRLDWSTSMDIFGHRSDRIVGLLEQMWPICYFRFARTHINRVANLYTVDEIHLKEVTTRMSIF